MDIKRIPRWAWYTAGGVAIGGGVLRVWKNRTVSDDLAEDGTDSSMTTGEFDSVGGYGYGTGGINPSGVIVPPVIIGGTGDQSDPATAPGVGGLIDLTSLYMGGAQGVFDAYDVAFGSLNQGWGDLDNLLSGLIQAGSAPAPANQMQPVVTVINQPPAAAAPRPPAAISSNPQPTTRQQSCADLYPNYPHRDNNFPIGPSGCYKMGCNSKGHKTMYFKSGRVNVISPTQKC